MNTTGSMFDIKIISWNCNGKLKAAINFAKQYVATYHIIHLSETKHNNFTKFTIPTGFACLSKPGARNKNKDRGGNIIFIKRQLYKCLRRIRYFEWGMVLYFNDTVILFIYLVPDDSSYYRDESTSEIFCILRNVEKAGKNGFAIGDHNGRIGNLEFSGKLYENNVDLVTNPQGVLMKSIYKECSFYPVNHLNIGINTFPGNFTYVKAEKKSQIDFLFTNNHNKLDYFHIEEKGLTLSDHKMLQCSIRIELNLPTKALISWTKDANIVGSIKKERIFKLNFNIDKEKLKAEVNANLNIYVEDVISGVIAPKDIIVKMNEILQKDFENCKVEGIKNNVTDDWNKLNNRELWDRIDWSGKLSSTKNYDFPEKDETFKFFKNLYSPENEPSVENLEINTNIYIPVTDDPISMEEIKEGFTQQKKGYNYTNNLLKPIKDSLFRVTFLLFNIIFFAIETIAWAPSLLFTIPKKGNLTLPQNWRGIQICEYFNSWYDRILSNRIRRWMSVDEFQTAYQKGKSCNTQIFTLRIITELAKKNKIPIFIAFVDLEKAFDRVRRVTMLNTLMQCNNQKEESLIHFIFKCERFKNIREEYHNFPSELHSFFNWELGALVLNKLHQQRK